MKRIAIVLFLLVIPFFMSACTDDSEGMKVGLIVSAAGANDNGYNEYAIDGLNAAEEEFDITTQVVTSAEDVPGSLATLADEGFDLIFSLEYNFTALISDDGSGQSIAEQYPDTTFVIFNALANTDEQGNKIHDNVVEVLFNVNQGSFLAGALAVLVNEDNDILFTDDAYEFTDPETYRGVAFVGGTQSSGISVFGWGFGQGVDYMAGEMSVTYNLFENYSAGFGATPEIQTTIDTYYETGVNVVFAAAGGVSTSMKNSANNHGKLAIDVDANQDASVPGSVLTSVLKDTSVTVLDLVGKYVDDELTDSTYSYGLTNEGFEAITDLSVIEGYIDDGATAQAKWTEIKGIIDDLVDDIIDGTIVVVDAQHGDTEPTYTHVTKAN